MAERALVDRIAAALYWPIVGVAVIVFFVAPVGAFTSLIPVAVLKVSTFMVAGVCGLLFVLVLFDRETREAADSASAAMRQQTKSFFDLRMVGDPRLRPVFLGLGAEALALGICQKVYPTELAFAASFLVAALMFATLKHHRSWGDL